AAALHTAPQDMMHSPSRIFTLVLTLLFACAACGSDTSSSDAPKVSTSSPSQSSTAPALPRSEALQAYCNWAYRYDEVVAKIDWSDFQIAIPSLDVAAQVAERWAASAPEAVRAAQRDLVRS